MVQKRPIVFLSVFKSGTHLMRQIIRDLTGLEFLEPPIIPGRVDYEDPEQYLPAEDKFYSWHLFPNQEVKERIMADNAKPVLLVRNIYDLSVSMYYHFARNIDHDIGRGRNVDHYFRAMDKADGLEAIIKGFYRPDFHWKGLGPHLRQISLMLGFAGEYPCFLTSFERLVTQKSEEISRLSRFLEINLPLEALTKISEASEFGVMKSKAIENGKGSHFRNGVKNTHVHELSSDHIEMCNQEIDNHAPELRRRVSKLKLDEILFTPGQTSHKRSDGPINK